MRAHSALGPVTRITAARALRCRSALVLLALLVPACSDGGTERADGLPDFTGPGSTPYVPSTQTPSTQTPGNTTPGNTTPGNTTPATGNGSGSPIGQQPSAGGASAAEGQDPDVALDPTSVAGLGAATMGGSGTSGERYHKTDVTRDGQNYFLMANGWGPGFDRQSISWNGTSFTVDELLGTQGPNYEPASYPTVFCGVYSDSRSRECGLPAALSSMTSLRTGWSWRANGNSGEYNAAYDIWVGTSNDISSHSGFLMVWYREPPGQQPAGRLTNFQNVSVQNVEGTWDIWTGQVLGKPIINWVRDEGQDTPSMEFDILDFVRDAEARGLTVPGNIVLSVAVGFEIWNGPITNLESVDFYVDVE